MREDTIKELTLQVHNEKKVNNFCRELVLCFENQYKIKEISIFNKSNETPDIRRSKRI